MQFGCGFSTYCSRLNDQLPICRRCCGFLLVVVKIVIFVVIIPVYEGAHAAWDEPLPLWATVEFIPEEFTDIFLALVQKRKFTARGFFMHHLVSLI